MDGERPAADSLHHGSPGGEPTDATRCLPTCSIGRSCDQAVRGFNEAPVFFPGTQQGDDQSINDRGRSAPKGVLEHRESAK